MPGMDGILTREETRSGDPDAHRGNYIRRAALNAAGNRRGDGVNITASRLPFLKRNG